MQSPFSSSFRGGSVKGHQADNDKICCSSTHKKKLRSPVAESNRKADDITGIRRRSYSPVTQPRVQVRNLTVVSVLLCTFLFVRKITLERSGPPVAPACYTRIIA